MRFPFIHVVAHVLSRRVATRALFGAAASQILITMQVHTIARESTAATSRAESVYRNNRLSLSAYLTKLNHEAARRSPQNCRHRRQDCQFYGLLPKRISHASLNPKPSVSGLRGKVGEGPGCNLSARCGLTHAVSAHFGPFHARLTAALVTRAAPGGNLRLASRAPAAPRRHPVLEPPRQLSCAVSLFQLVLDMLYHHVYGVVLLHFILFRIRNDDLSVHVFTECIDPVANSQQFCSGAVLGAVKGFFAYLQ